MKNKIMRLLDEFADDNDCSVIAESDFENLSEKLTESFNQELDKAISASFEKPKEEIKTLVLHICVYNLNVEWILLDGDYSHFNEVTINSGMNTVLEEQVCEFLYHPETGELLHPFVKDLSLIESKNWDKFAIVYFV